MAAYAMHRVVVVVVVVIKAAASPTLLARDNQFLHLTGTKSSCRAWLIQHRRSDQPMSCSFLPLRYNAIRDTSLFVIVTPSA